LTNLELKIETPEWMEPMFQKDYRYIAIHGGRASGKSHAIAEYIVERSVMAKCDILCAREFQKSLQYSVKKLIESKIASLKVEHMFEIQRDCIKSIYGGIIAFVGLSQTTSESIKSFEAFDILWYEEAQVCSQRSLDMIRPTMRKDDAQIIFTWNPRFETDPIDVYFREEDTTARTLVLEVNYTDNPWFPPSMKDEMEEDLKRDIDKYNHIWLGQYVKNSESRIFRNWRVEEFETPPGAMLRLGADFGFSNDPTTLVRCFLNGRKLYIEYEAYMHGCEVHDTAALFMSVPDSEKWPIVADSSRPETISYLKRQGFPAMLAAVKGPRSVEEGIKWLKSHEIIVHPRCQKVIEEMTLYKYKENKQTGEIYPIPEDKNNHCIDALRYACEGLRRAHAVEETKRKYQSVHVEPVRNPFANRYKKG